MKKLFYLSLAGALMLVSCAKELGTTESVPGIVTYSGGIKIVAEAVESRVSVDVVEESSVMSWEDGDEITVFHNGKTGTFVTSDAGVTATFTPKTEGDKIEEVDPTKPFIAYYNVASVDNEGKATFSIVADQVEGESSNKVTLCAYSETTVAGEDGTVSAKFTPIVSVLEFHIKASSTGYADISGNTKYGFDDIDYKLTKVVLTPKNGISGYTTFSSAVYNPAEGSLAPTGTASGALTYNFAEETNIKDGCDIKFVIGSCKMESTGATMDWYKGDIKNYTKDIWASSTIDFTSTKHVYQPVKTKEFGYGDYTSFYNRFYGLRNKQNEFINYCNDEGILVLSGDIQMYGGSGNRIAQFPGLTWTLDGRGHYFFDVDVLDTETSKYAFFTNLKADIRNLNFGKPGREKNSVKMSVAKIGDNTRIAPIQSVAKNVSVTIENCKNYLDYTLTVDSDAYAASASGMVGLVDTGASVTLIDCENRGDISIVVTKETSKNCYASGFIGQQNNGVNAKGCKNYGNITLSGPYKGNGTIAGIVPYTANTSPTIIDDCENHGTIFNHNTFTEAGSIQVWAGGIAGRLTNVNEGVPHSDVKNSTNYGFVSVKTDSSQKPKAGGIVMDFQNNDGSNNTARGNVECISGEGKGEACWYTTWVGTTSVFQGGSVLKGITVNGVAIDDTNYTKKNIATSKNDTEVASVLILLAE